MQDSKDISWASDFVADRESVEDETPDAANQRNAKGTGNGAAESDGWQQYRKWISKAPAPRSRRSGIDPSLYTWKGYRSWTEQIKRNWSDS
jgi:hypothetical protein